MAAPITYCDVICLIMLVEAGRDLIRALQECRAVAKDFPTIKFREMIVDNTCMQLASHPDQFDVMVRCLEENFAESTVLVYLWLLISQLLSSSTSSCRPRWHSILQPEASATRELQSACCDRAESWNPCSVDQRGVFISARGDYRAPTAARAITFVSKSVPLSIRAEATRVLVACR